jgi:predicted ABC-type ATPase
MSERRILIIAGPNGAGKTTFAQEFLPSEAGCPIFVNADLIAAGLSPFTPELAALRAGRIMLEQIHEHAQKGDSFAFETTLSGRIYAQMIPRWQAEGYLVKLFFLQLPSPEMAIARVRQRVASGGHNVPEDVIRRRFDAGLRNFNQVYKPLVGEWVLYDNSGEEPVRLDEGYKP